MLGGFFLVLTGNILRLGAGLLVIVLLARQLGPEGFGVFAYGLALASLAVVVLNFGLGTAILRRFGAEPDHKAEAMAQALTGKLLLLLPLFVLALAASLLLPSAHADVFLVLLLAQVAESFSELYQLGFRAASRFKDEARTASIVALVHIATIAGVAWYWPHPLACAGGFLLSRLLGLGVISFAAQKAFARIPLSTVRSAWHCLQDAFAYAIEFAISTANTQVDSVLIQSQLGVRVVGLYQAGMKLVQGVSRLAPILALYLLPRLTRRVKASDMKQAALTLAIFGGIGAVAGGVLTVAAQSLTFWLFGPEFAQLAGLLPWFGLLLALRFVETGAGLVLVAADLQSRKVWLVALQLLALLGAGLWALQRWGLLGWLWAAIGSTVMLLMLYAGLWRWHRRTPSDIKN